MTWKRGEEDGNDKTWLRQTAGGAYKAAAAASCDVSEHVSSNVTDRCAVISCSYTHTDRHTPVRERERENFICHKTTQTQYCNEQHENDNVAGCQKRLSPIKLATLQNRQIRQN